MKKIVMFFCLICGGAFGLSAQSLTAQTGDDGTYGFVDDAGRFVIAPQYDEIHFDFSDGVACVVKGKKYIFIDAVGKPLSKAYDWADYIDANGLCLVGNGGKIDESGNFIGGKLGFVDARGVEVLPVKYALIDDFNEFGIARINEGGSLDKNGEINGGKNGFIATDGSILIKPKYAYVGEFDEQGLCWVNVGGKLDGNGNCVGGKFGYIDNSGREIIEPRYTFLGPIDEQGICWVNIGGKLFTGDKMVKAAMKSYANLSLKEQAEKRDQLEDAITGGKKDVFGRKIFGGKYGFASVHGREIVPVKYAKTANYFVEGYAWVFNKKYGYVDESGRELCKLIYDGAADFHNGVAAVMRLDKKESLFGFLNAQGREITELKYAEVGSFEDGFAFVRTASGYDRKTRQRIYARYGFVDDSGREITPMKYDTVARIANGIAACRIGRDWGYVNAQGEEITPFVLVGADAFTEEVAWVKLKLEDAQLVKRGERLVSSGVHALKKVKQPDRLVLINKNGIALTDGSHVWAQKPQEGFIAARDAEEKAGWLDYRGDVAIPFIYSGASSFFDGLAAVQQDGQWGYIDRTGQIVIPCKYESVSTRFVNDVACVQVNLGNSAALWGGLDRKGEMVIPALMMNLEDIREIVEAVYVPNGRKPLTENQVLIFNKYKQNTTYRPDITMTIPDAMWAY